MKSLIVSGVRATDQGTKSPIELLWTAKKELWDSHTHWENMSFDQEKCGNAASSELIYSFFFFKYLIQEYPRVKNSKNILTDVNFT